MINEESNALPVKVFVSDEHCKVEKLTQFITATALKTISKTGDSLSWYKVWYGSICHTCKHCSDCNTRYCVMCGGTLTII